MRGTLRIYLGAAPGVGKTFAMLGEGHRRRDRGGDVVIGFVEHHGRPRTEELVAGLEQVPRHELLHRGSRFTEMDLDAILARRPDVVLVDELAHTNVPGSRNAKRWQDVEELLKAGIDVISTVNVQHLESLNDVVEQITGIPQRETVPDGVVRSAGQLELVDMSPESLRRRMAHGNVYAAEKVDAALSNYFRVGNLTALRELALLWVADRVDEGLARYREQEGITRTWEARERIVVALTGGPEGDTLIRRAARIAARSGRGDLVAVHVARGDGLTGGSPVRLAEQQALVESVGGAYHQVAGEDVATALLEFARGVNATQIVVGTSRRPLWQYVFGAGVGRQVIDGSGDIDVHMVNHAQAGKGRVPRPRSALSRGRITAGFVLSVLGPALLTLALVPLSDRLALTTDVLLYLTVAVGVALVGGLWPAVIAALAGGVLANWYFTPPLHTLDIDTGENLLALLLSLLVAVAVSLVVDLSARYRRRAARASAEAATLSHLSTEALRSDRSVEALLEQVRETFSLESVTMLERGEDGWTVVARAGGTPCAVPEEADVRVSASDDLLLALRGRTLPASDRRVLSAFAFQAEAALDRRRLRAEAGRARSLAEADRVRTALLAAVSHDLRTPLASIKASVGSLRQQDVVWDAADEADLLATIEESADQLNGLVADLLDMTRLRTGVVAPLTRAVPLDEVVLKAVLPLPPGRLRIEVPETLPQVSTDPGLLERAVANVVANALRHSEGPVLVSGSEGAGHLELRIADRGPGVADADKERIFAPFQRLGDAPGGAGVGLGLAVARGLTEAVGGSLTAQDTPGGGLTMVFTVPIASPGERSEPEMSPEPSPEVSTE
ncbi:sensor histidine kinase [Actinocorallia longicatena]|uniref:histidine kinase n=1 Tax=Actinocorallia longicatena TaxID=111803 RepID=A0ABP6QCK3_9ACTN